MNRRFLLENLLQLNLPQLNAPTISLSNSTLTINPVADAEYYDIYVDGVLTGTVAGD